MAKKEGLPAAGVKNMTQGSILKAILLFALPLILGHRPGGPGGL